MDSGAGTDGAAGEAGSTGSSGSGPVGPVGAGAAGEVGGRAVPLTQQIGRAVVLALAILFGVFSVANAQRVTFSWVFGRTEAGPAGGGVPLIVLLVAAFALGALVTATVTRRRRSRAAQPPRTA